jgi:thiol:disulfide interchange protein DsbG
MTLKVKSFLKPLAAAAITAAIPGMLFASSVNLSTPAAKLVTKLARGKIKITQSFDAIGNLEGFVVEPESGKGQKTIVYADKKGQYMFLGNLVNSQGVNLTQSNYQTYINSAMAPKIFTAASKTAWIAEGSKNAPHKAYIMVEPNCIACHMLYEKIKPLIKSGQLAVRWIFVAFLKPDSKAKAAAILQASNPDKAFAYDEAKFNEKIESGGIKPATDISSATKAKIKKNMAFMTKAGFVGTPAVIYKTTKGSYSVMRGFDPALTGKQIVSNMGSSF